MTNVFFRGQCQYAHLRSSRQYCWARVRRILFPRLRARKHMVRTVRLVTARWAKVTDPWPLLWQSPCQTCGHSASVTKEFSRQMPSLALLMVAICPSRMASEPCQSGVRCSMPRRSWFRAHSHQDHASMQSSTICESCSTGNRSIEAGSMGEKIGMIVQSRITSS